MDGRYPMLLAPCGKDYLWGGIRLKELFGKNLDMAPLAETWECSVHPDGPSTVKNGIFAGKTLKEVLDAHPEFLGTKGNPADGLPLLVKFIDAAKDLSIQVHPDDAFAKEFEGSRGKAEMWYVLKAAEGAKIVLGFEHRVNEEILREARKKGDFRRHLHYIPVKAGDAFFVPPGTVHAIGAGIILAEVQESSNLTYRVYDYDRTGADGKMRKLHLDKAFRVMNMNPVMMHGRGGRTVRYETGCSRETLCRCRYFEVEHIRCTERFSFDVRREACQILLCLEGEGTVEGECVKAGDCLFLPAGYGGTEVRGRIGLLKIRN
ncbi:MAG: type I phosphomannose isomerase catalytic subunit [Lachnospiraceae bacterium]|nr:type I phosphomannose isomerase catalytic subunit [Lachnospiraceae bacterium]